MPPFCDTLHRDPGEPHIASRAKARKATTGKVDPSWLSTLGKSFDGRKTFIVPHPPMNGIPPTIPTATTAISFCHWAHTNYWNFINVNICSFLHQDFSCFTNIQFREPWWIEFILAHQSWFKKQGQAMFYSFWNQTKIRLYPVYFCSERKYSKGWNTNQTIQIVSINLVNSSSQWLRN